MVMWLLMFSPLIILSAFVSDRKKCALSAEEVDAIIDTQSVDVQAHLLQELLAALLFKYENVPLDLDIDISEVVNSSWRKFSSPISRKSGSGKTLVKRPGGRKVSTDDAVRPRSFDSIKSSPREYSSSSTPTGPQQEQRLLKKFSGRSQSNSGSSSSLVTLEDLIIGKASSSQEETPTSPAVSNGVRATKSDPIIVGTPPRRSSVPKALRNKSAENGRRKIGILKRSNESDEKSKTPEPEVEAEAEENKEEAVVDADVPEAPRPMSSLEFAIQERIKVGGKSSDSAGKLPQIPAEPENVDLAQVLFNIDEEKVRAMKSRTTDKTDSKRKGLEKQGILKSLLRKGEAESKNVDFEDPDDEPKDTFLLKSIRSASFKHTLNLILYRASIHPYAIHQVCSTPSIIDAELKLKLLLCNGAAPYVNTHDDTLMTPLHLIFQKFNQLPSVALSLLKVLLDYGADPDIANGYTMTAFHYFLRDVYKQCLYGNEALRLLLECTDPFATFDGGYEIIHMCMTKADFIKHSDKFLEAQEICKDAQNSYRRGAFKQAKYPDYGLSLEAFAL